MNASEGPLRFGLVGTGHWARIAHAPALASTDGIEFAAVWGRNADAAADLAASYHATAHHDLSAFLAGIDAVAFAVPPDVQAPIAMRAGSAGKHLLLEKPIAISAADADALADAAEQAQVASVVFFTARFQADIGLAGRGHSRRRMGGRVCGLAGFSHAGGQPVQHPVAPGQGRAVGPRPTRDLATVGQPRPGPFGDRRGRPSRRHPSRPAP